jgi:hypothetical protein
MPAPTIAQLRQLIVDRLAPLGNVLHVEKYWPDRALRVPALVIGVPAIAYREALDGFYHTATFPLYLLVATGARGTTRAQAQLDGFLDEAGATSIRALLSDPPRAHLAGSEVSIGLTGWANADEHGVVGIDYLGAVGTLVVEFGPDTLDVGL